MKTAIILITLTISSLSLKAQSLDKTLTNADKEQIINVFYDAWDSGSREMYEQVIAKDLIDHDRNPMVKASDFDGMWGLVQSLQGLKMKHNIKQIHFLENNKVMVRWNASAKHVGDFFGMPASNKTAYYAGHDIFQLNDKGQITEMWHIEQIFQLMQQLKPQLKPQ